VSVAAQSGIEGNNGGENEVHAQSAMTKSGCEQGRYGITEPQTLEVALVHTGMHA
jgi:hypothetical protein